MAHPTLPAKANPLAQALGRKLKLVRKGRKLGRDVAAKQLGINLMLYVYLETGRVLPKPAVANRIYNWMLLGVTYEGLPPAKAEAADQLEPERVLRVTLSKDLIHRLAIESARLGLSQASLAELFIARGIENKPALATLGEAIEAVNKARVQAAMRESPEIKEILLADLPVAIAAGETLVKAETQKSLAAPIEKLLDLNLMEPEVGLVEDE